MSFIPSLILGYLRRKLHKQWFTWIFHWFNNFIVKQFHIKIKKGP
jgi:membrane protease YdiL (CAAX protease family)